MTTYAEFLAAKAQHDGASGFEPVCLPEWLRPFQLALTEWSVRMGRAAVFADCGLGKTPMQLVWAQNVHRRTGRPVLVVAPLAVSSQTEVEAAKFGMDAAVSRDGGVPAPITITNYERLERFDAHRFGGVVCDESSAIKAFDGTRRALVTEFLRTHRYRLLCTATAAPNDYIELGTSSEALGYLGYMDMLTRFFTRAERTASTTRGYLGKAVEWRFKGHAEDPFWSWVASWARAIRRPSDLGFDDAGYELPPLQQRVHVVDPGAEDPEDAGALFAVPASGLQAERAELRRTLVPRCERVAQLLGDADRAVAWCHLNDESSTLARLIPDAVQVTGADSPDAKEEALTAFTRGEVRTLITKPSIAGWGLNWQHCHRTTFFPSHSYEQYYQAVRRFWRFGQQHPVRVDVVTTPGGSNALANLRRKATAADRMFDALVGHMRAARGVDRRVEYPLPVEVPPWAC